MEQTLPTDSLATSVVDSIGDQMLTLVTHPSKQLFEDTFTQWGQKFLDFGIRVILCVVIFYLGRLLIKWLMKLLTRYFFKRIVHQDTATFLTAFARIALMIILVVVIVQVLGFKAVSFAAIVASLGVTIGMALSGQLQNFAGGVILLFTRPLKNGDYVKVRSEEGSVMRIGLFHTTISTVDNKKIYVPNSILTSDMIVNYSEQDKRRCDWLISMEYDEDMDRVRGVLQTLIRRESRILANPEPLVVLNKFADSSVEVKVGAWVKTEDYWSVYWSFNESVYKEFNAQGISFPYNHLQILPPDGAPLNVNQQ